jgi:uncharacterized protein DUF4136
MSRRVALALMVVIAVSAGLGAQKVSIEADEATDFSQFKTFAIREGTLTAKAPALNSELMKKRLETEIRKRLVERGLTESTGAADLNVFFTFSSRPKGETDRVPAGARGLGTRRVVTEAFEGTLTVDVRNTSKRELVFRAVAVEEKESPAKLAERVDEMVKKAIEKYPPKK